MIKDLSGNGHQTVGADVLVIGGGTAGLIMAERLSAKSLQVVVLESGALRQDEEEHPFNAVIHRRSEYAGAAHGRFRCLGGTSTRWGGAMIPFLARDIVDQQWVVEFQEIVQYLDEVERIFQLPQGPYDFPDLVVGDGGDHIPRLAKWPTFPNRNVAHLVGSSLRRPDGPAVWLNATVTDFLVQGDKLTGVTARAPDRSSLQVQAKEVILAAGAIESTRLLLLMDRQNGNRLFSPGEPIGRYFYDHLSVPVAELEVLDRTALNRLVGYRFESGGTMRNLRFELSESTHLREGIPPCFAHISFESQGGGFDALREFFQYVQQRRLPSWGTLGRLAAATPWLTRAVWWRFVEQRLLYPSDASIQVQMVIEQVPRADCRITLSDDRVDFFEQPMAVIDWAIDKKDEANLTRATDAFLQTWESSNLASIARWNRRPAGEAEADLAMGGGIYHPGGSTRMGRTAEEGVVDRNLRLFRAPNVCVVATSVLPNGGGSNPTMMLLMLALRAVDDIAARVRRSS